MENNTLFIIPARGGSKGIPYKNIKNFAGKPLIYYAIDLARKFVDDKDICISTDDSKIISFADEYGLRVPFVRPSELATDTATTNDVLLHALKYYEDKNIYYNRIVLLQPTSPLRQNFHIEEAIALYTEGIDMVVSVCKSSIGSVLCKENDEGFIESVFNKNNLRRQDTQDLYIYNGAIYVINVESLKKKGLARLDKKVKYVMSEEYSIDIDIPLDWLIAEHIYKKLFIQKGN